MRLNSCNFVGNVLATPKFEPAKTKDDSARLSFRLGVNRIKSDKYDVINVTLWGAYAETCANKINKGKELSVTGELRTNSEKQADGTWKNYWGIKGDRVGFGRDSKKHQAEQAQSADLDSVAANLVAQAKASSEEPSTPLAQLVAKMVSQGISQDEAVSLATEYLASQGSKSSSSVPAPSTSDDPFIPSEA